MKEKKYATAHALSIAQLCFAVGGIIITASAFGFMALFVDPASASILLILGFFVTALASLGLILPIISMSIIKSESKKGFTGTHTVLAIFQIILGGLFGLIAGIFILLADAEQVEPSLTREGSEPGKTEVYDELPASPEKSPFL